MHHFVANFLLFQNIEVTFNDTLHPLQVTSWSSRVYSTLALKVKIPTLKYQKYLRFAVTAVQSDFPIESYRRITLFGHV